MGYLGQKDGSKPGDLISVLGICGGGGELIPPSCLTFLPPPLPFPLTLSLTALPAVFGCIIALLSIWLSLICCVFYSGSTANEVNYPVSGALNYDGFVMLNCGPVTTRCQQNCLIHLSLYWIISFLINKTSFAQLQTRQTVCKSVESIRHSMRMESGEVSEVVGVSGADLAFWASL